MVFHRYIPVFTSSQSTEGCWLVIMTSVVFSKVTLKGEPKVRSVEQAGLGDPDRLIICPRDHMVDALFIKLVQWKAEPQALLKSSEVPTQQDSQPLCKALLKWVVMLPLSNGCFEHKHAYFQRTAWTKTTNGRWCPLFGLFCLVSGS